MNVTCLLVADLTDLVFRETKSGFSTKSRRKVLIQRIESKCSQKAESEKISEKKLFVNFICIDGFALSNSEENPCLF